MARLEDLTPNAAVRGILPDVLVTVVNVQWFGSEALELTYKTPDGRVANVLLYRHDEARLEVVEHGRSWSFDGDGALFRLVSEAHRIRLAHLFDPVLAVHTSIVEPLPHQITAVYDVMLPRQPLRFLLADDPGAGQTIMAGLLLWAHESFAYADSYDEAAGRYRGLRAGQHVPLSADSPTGLLVRPEVAVRQQEKETRAAATTTGMPTGGEVIAPAPGGGPTPGGSVIPPVTPPSPSAPKRYHGTVTLDPTRVGRDAGRIGEEVIAHLAGLADAEVKVTLEIEAEIPNGAPDHVVRVVTENSRTLRFTSQGFEVE